MVGRFLLKDFFRTPAALEKVHRVEVVVCRIVVDARVDVFGFLNEPRVDREFLECSILRKKTGQ